MQQQYSWAIGFSDYTDVYVRADSLESAVFLAGYENDSTPICATCTELGVDVNL